LYRWSVGFAFTSGSCKSPPQNQQKRKKGNKKGERGREPTIAIVVLQIMTIVGESSQKLSKITEMFSSRYGVYFVISKKMTNYSTKDKSWRKLAKDKTGVAIWRKDRSI
jgi:hypothetical protein